MKRNKNKQTNTKPNGVVRTRWATQAPWASCYCMLYRSLIKQNKNLSLSSINSLHYYVAFMQFLLTFHPYIHFSMSASPGLWWGICFWYAQCLCKVHIDDTMGRNGRQNYDKLPKNKLSNFSYIPHKGMFIICKVLFLVFNKINSNQDQY